MRSNRRISESLLLMAAPYASGGLQGTIRISLQGTKQHAAICPSPRAQCPSPSCQDLNRGGPYNGHPRARKDGREPDASRPCAYPFRRRAAGPSEREWNPRHGRYPGQPAQLLGLVSAGAYRQHTRINLHTRMNLCSTRRNRDGLWVRAGSPRDPHGAVRLGFRKMLRLRFRVPKRQGRMGGAAGRAGNTRAEEDGGGEGGVTWKS